MAVTGLIRRRVHSRTAADAAADHSGAAGAGRTVNDININNRVGQALGINTFTSDIKDIFVAGAAKDNNVGIDANVSPFARIEQNGVRAGNLPVKSSVVTDIHIFNQFPLRKIKQGNHPFAETYRQNQIGRPVIFGISRLALTFAQILQRIKPGGLRHSQRVKTGIAQVHRHILPLALVGILIKAAHCRLRISRAAEQNRQSADKE